jgi:hypothetical protein
VVLAPAGCLRALNAARFAGVCVVGRVLLVGEGKHDTTTPAIERRLGRLLSL